MDFCPSFALHRLQIHEVDKTCDKDVKSSYSSRTYENNFVKTLPRINTLITDTREDPETIPEAKIGHSLKTASSGSKIGGQTSPATREKATTGAV